MATHFAMFSFTFYVIFPYFIIVFRYFFVFFWFHFEPINNHYFDYYQFWLLNGFTCYQLWYMNHFLVTYWFDSGRIILLEKNLNTKKIKISYLSRLILRSANFWRWLIHHFYSISIFFFSIAKITIQFLSLYLLLYQLI